MSTPTPTLTPRGITGPSERTDSIAQLAAAAPTPRRRLAVAASDRIVYLVGIPLIILLVAYVLIPLSRTFLRSFGDDGPAVNYGAFLSGRALTALVNSVGISVATVLGCATLGLILAVLVSRFEFRGRAFLEVFALLPMAMPPLVGAAAFSQAFTETGVVPRLIQQSTGIDASVVAFDGISGVLLMHVMTIYPFFYLSLRAALLSADASLEEAARGLGSGTLRTWRTVIVPMLTPALVSGSLITFMIGMGSLTAPQMFGVDTLTTQLLENRTNGAESRVAAQAAVLALICVLFLVLVQWYQARRSYAARSKGAPRIHRRSVNGWSRLAVIAVIALLVVVLSIPLLTILLISFNKSGTWVLEAIPPLNTLDNYTKVFTDRSVFTPVLTSARLAAISTLIALIVGVIGAVVVTRWRPPGRSLIDVVIMLPWALPGTIVALNLIYAFIQPGVTSFGQVWVGTETIILLAYCTLFVPLIFRSSKAALEALDPSLDEASRGLGAGPLRTFQRITAPLIWRALLSGALFVFIAGFGEYVASVLLYTPRIIPMSIQMAQFLDTNKLGMAAAYGIIKILLTLVLLVLAHLLEQSSRRGPLALPATAL